MTVTTVHDIKIYVGFIETNISSLMLDYKTVTVGGPYDGRPVVLRAALWRGRSGVGLGSIRRRRSGRLEVFVEVTALGTGAECLQSVSSGVAVSWKHLRQGVVGGESRWRRRSKSTCSLTTRTVVVIVSMAVTSTTVDAETIASVLFISRFFTGCSSMLK